MGGQKRSRRRCSKDGKQNSIFPTNVCKAFRAVIHCNASSLLIYVTYRNIFHTTCIFRIMVLLNQIRRSNGAFNFDGRSVYGAFHIFAICVSRGMKCSVRHGTQRATTLEARYIEESFPINQFSPKDDQKQMI